MPNVIQSNEIMTIIRKLALTLFVLVNCNLACQKQIVKSMVSYTWEYKGEIHGTILIPPGFEAETQNYREGIITYLRYADSSCIVLQHGGMYRVPMFQEAQYVISKTEERTDRTVRTGSIQGTEYLWREDNMKRIPVPTTPGKLHPLFYLYPPNIAYDKVPKNRASLFNEALNSFVWDIKR
jgi:hypothetical protein